MILVICVFLFSFLAGFSIGLTFQLELAAALLVGIVFAGASIGIVFPLLHELGLSQKRLGQILIAATMVLDVVCILIVSLINFSVGGELNLLQFILVIVIVVVFFIAIMFAIGPFWQYMENKISEAKALEWEMRTTFAVIMLLAVLTGFILEIEAIIGAFLAGMIMGQSKSAQRLEEKIGSIGYGFFIPIFFFVIGMKMDLGLFTDPIFIGTLIVFLLVLFAVKIGSSVLSSKFMDYNWKTGLVVGFVMIPSLSIGIAAAELGNRVGLFTATPQIYNLVISLIVISSIIIPILTRTSAKRFIPDLITEGSTWHIHLEHDLGIYLDDYYQNVFDELSIKELPYIETVRLHPDTPVTAILAFMQKFHQMDFPVVSEDNKLIGFVDFQEAKDAIIHDRFEETARSIMQEDLIYVTTDDSLGTTLTKMKLHALELLPIVEPDTLNFIGTVTKDDILRFIRIRALHYSISEEDREEMIKQKERVWVSDESRREPSDT